MSNCRGIAVNAALIAVIMQFKSLVSLKTLLTYLISTDFTVQNPTISTISNAASVHALAPSPFSLVS